MKNQKTISQSDTWVGVTTKPKPLSRNLCKAHLTLVTGTKPADNCDNYPTSRVEAGKGIEQQTIDVPGSAGNMSKGDNNVVTPAKSKLTCHTEVSNIKDHKNGTKQIPEKQPFIDQLVSNTEVLSSHKVASSQGVSKQHSVSSIVEDTANTHADDDHFVLLFDINNAWDTDKFLTSVCSKRGRRYKSGTLSTNCSVSKNWEKQSQFNFGFIPLSNFVAPLTNFINQDDFTRFEAHKEIRKSGRPNFMYCRIPVQTQLCIKEWEKVLQGYWDTQLIDLLSFGFPLDFDRKTSLKCDNKNHASAIDYPEDVETYLQEEAKFGAIMGPFSVDPMPHCHKSPFMTREKPHSDHRRVIVDLSWPKGFSVNSGVDKDSYLDTEFVLSLPTIDDITSCVRASGPGSHLYKIDISRAFRHVKIDPGDLDLLGLTWRDVTYVDMCLPFGSRHGTQIFQRISDAVRHVMRQHGFTVINYVDDFVGVATPSVARRFYVFLQELLARLGLDVSSKKLVPPGTRVICLGVEVDTRQRTLAIPEEKMRRISDMVDAWRHKSVCTKRELQSLLGNLLYVHKCVAPARIFLNRMLELLRNNYDAYTIQLTHDFKRDLRWFSNFLSEYNGVSFYDHVRTHHVVELDVCLEVLGGRWENLIYHLPLPSHYGNLGIAQLEMINILLAIRVFASLCHRKSILIKCDNAAVVSVLTTGKAKDPFLAAVARNVWMELARKDIQAVYKHIPGKINQVADLLSRWINSPAQIVRLQSLVENPMWLPVQLNMLDLDYDI